MSADEELAVCLYLDRLEAIGTAARKQMITGCANDILRRSFTPCESDTKPPEVGPLWTQRFLERHPEYKVRKQRSIDSNRKNAHDPEVFEDWFHRYKALVDEKGILPGDIYNFDETGFRIGVGKNQWIVTRDSSREVYLGSCTNQDFVTICKAICSDGTVLPPMVILSGGLLACTSFYPRTEFQKKHYPQCILENWIAILRS